MPTYEYECKSCQTHFERAQKFTDPPVSECPECGGPVRKVLFPAGIVFKGSGWYITESRKTTPGDGSATADSTPEAKVDGAKGDGAKSDAAKSDSASATKSEAAGTGTKTSPD